MNLMCVGDSSVNIYIRADGGVLARSAVHAGAGRAFSQSGGVLLLLTLTHDGFTSQPLAHGLLITRSNLLIHLERVQQGYSASALVSITSRVAFTHLFAFVEAHGELIVAQEKRPDLFP